MDYLTEFRDGELLKRMGEKLSSMRIQRPLKLMEVCGTHTMAIRRFGLHRLLPEGVSLVSGPGCPVCVTENAYIDRAIAYAKEGKIITTFGDMVRVPGSYNSLEKVRAEGGDVYVVYSPYDALDIAEKHPDRDVIFLAVGFETTVPGIASTMKHALERGLENFFVLCGNKVIPPALHALVADETLAIDGFILPGHVSTIIGVKPYEFLALEFGVPCVISGFEPVDIVSSVIKLVETLESGTPKIVNNYTRVVRYEGNPVALKLMEEVFEEASAVWRGIGEIPGSGLTPREIYRRMDAGENLPVSVPPPKEHPGCRCGDVLKGVIIPPECPLFGKACTPQAPVGPCMVSSEGSCSAYYKYGGEAL